MESTAASERLRRDARSLFLSTATIDDMLEWATPRQIDAISRLLATEIANREASKKARLLKRARFPVVKTLDGYGFTHVKLPDGYTREQLVSLEFIPRAQDLVFYCSHRQGQDPLGDRPGPQGASRRA
ncbi:ATP-binding protein [Bifidobacterium cuniculi]|uniref:IstB-like ATP-binding protein n=1 Tax=Bifidobacterium cuniculi TaxID=1688 RepID=A0A087AZL5_9BIFI|nr:ATP-binding protein [Bifidobacterium cuniculi]KFI64215.1 IstB-like ATP-binding protein [Bifidobacterium cuniculi]